MHQRWVRWPALLVTLIFPGVVAVTSTVPVPAEEVAVTVVSLTFTVQADADSNTRLLAFTVAVVFGMLPHYSADRI